MESMSGPTVLAMLFAEAAGQNASVPLGLCTGGDGYYYMSAWQGYDAQLFVQTTVYDIVMKVFLDVINI